MNIHGIYVYKYKRRQHFYDVFAGNFNSNVTLPVLISSCIDINHNKGWSCVIKKNT